MPGEEGTRVSHISHPGSPGTLVTALSIWMCPFSILNWQANKYICAVKHALWKQALCLRINGYIRLMKHIPCLTYLSWQQQSIKTNRLPFAYRQCISILGNHWPENPVSKVLNRKCYGRKPSDLGHDSGPVNGWRSNPKHSCEEKNSPNKPKWYANQNDIYGY